MQKKKNPKLSIIILSFNTQHLLQKCLDSLKKVKTETEFEVIVPDNGSTDGTVEMLKKDYPEVKVIEIGENLGFAQGNNRARKYTHGEYVLFLNSDTNVPERTLAETIKYLENHSDVGALTCKILLPDGGLDKDARRSFITPWIGLTHLYLKLDKFFPKSKLFSQYWYGYISPDIEHEVDVIQGAYFLTKKEILDSVDWFDEDYFLDGEDIDLCYRIKEKGWKIIYYPKVSITHHKGATKGKISSRSRDSVPLEERLKYRMAGVDSMEIFVRKHLWKKYPYAFNLFVITGIKLMKLLRYTQTVIRG